MFSVAGVGNRRLRRSELIQRRAIVWMLSLFPMPLILFLPRVGEVSRCGMLAKYDDVSFCQIAWNSGNGTLDRYIDHSFDYRDYFSDADARLPSFFEETGTKVPSLVHLVTSPWFYVVFLVSLVY